MAKTPSCNSQIFLWKVIVIGYTEYLGAQGSTSTGLSKMTKIAFKC